MPGKGAMIDAGVGAVHGGKTHGGGAIDGREQGHLEARRLRADALDLAGVTIAEMARTLQVSHQTIRNDLKFVRERRRAELAAVRDKELDRELARLERLRRNYVTQAEGGDIRAAELMLAIHDRKARILGLNAPAVAMLEVQYRSPLALIDDRLNAIASRAIEVDEAAPHVNGNGTAG